LKKLERSREVRERKGVGSGGEGEDDAMRKEEREETNE